MYRDMIRVINGHKDNCPPLSSIKMMTGCDVPCRQAQKRRRDVMPPVVKHKNDDGM